MEFKNYYYNVVFNTSSTIREILAKQNDTGRGMRVKVAELGFTEKLEQCYMLLMARKPDGTIVVLTGQPKGDYFEFEFTRQLFTRYGTVQAELRLLGVKGEDLGTKNFNFIVERSVSDEITSSDDFSQLSGLVAKGEKLPAIIKEVEKALNTFSGKNTELDEAEKVRKANEEKRQAEEAKRQEAETKRQKSAEELKTEEAKRVKQETERQQFEEARKQNESERQGGENVRKASEAERVKNEKDRQSKESERRKNEEERQAQESTRKSNEQVRETNEAQRIETHKECEKIKANNSSLAEELKGLKEQATKDSERAAADHQTAAKDHERITEQAELIKKLEGGQIINDIAELKENKADKTELAEVKEFVDEINEDLDKVEDDTTELNGVVFGHRELREDAKDKGSSWDLQLAKIEELNELKQVVDTKADKTELASTQKELHSFRSDFADNMHRLAEEITGTYAKKTELDTKANKKDVPEVIDRLDTLYTHEALSARQGAVLKYDITKLEEKTEKDKEELTKTLQDKASREDFESVREYAVGVNNKMYGLTNNLKTEVKNEMRGEIESKIKELAVAKSSFNIFSSRVKTVEDDVYNVIQFLKNKYGYK